MHGRSKNKRCLRRLRDKGALVNLKTAFAVRVQLFGLVLPGRISMHVLPVFYQNSSFTSRDLDQEALVA